MKSRESGNPIDREIEKLLADFKKIIEHKDGVKFLAQSTAWKKRFNAIKAEIPEDKSFELLKCDLRLTISERVVIKRTMRKEMQQYSQKFKDQFDAYLSQVEKPSQKRAPDVPTLKKIEKNYQKFINGEFFKDFQMLQPELAEKFCNWVEKRMQKERDAELKREMKEHLINFRDQMAYLHDPETAKPPATSSYPETLSKMEAHYNQFKNSDFFEEYKMRYPERADQFERLMEREIKREYESLAEFREHIQSKLEAINEMVNSSKASYDPQLLKHLNLYNDAIIEKKDLEKLRDRNYYQVLSKGLDDLKTDLKQTKVEAPKKAEVKVPKWGVKPKETENKTQRHPMMGHKALKQQDEKLKHSEQVERRASRGSSRGSTG